MYLPVALVRAGNRYEDVGYVFAVAAAITGIGMLALGGRIERAGRKGLMSLSLGGMAAGLVLLPFSLRLALIAVVAGLISLGRSVGLTSARSHAADTSSASDRATALGVYELFFSAGKVAGAIVTGYLLDELGGLTPLLIAAGVIAVWAAIARRRTSPQSV